MTNEAIKNKAITNYVIHYMQSHIVHMRITGATTVLHTLQYGSVPFSNRRIPAISGSRTYSARAVAGSVAALHRRVAASRIPPRTRSRPSRPSRRGSRREPAQTVRANTWGTEHTPRRADGRVHDAACAACLWPGQAEVRDARLIRRAGNRSQRRRGGLAELAVRGAAASSSQQPTTSTASAAAAHSEAKKTCWHSVPGRASASLALPRWGCGPGKTGGARRAQPGPAQTASLVDCTANTPSGQSAL